MPQNGEVRKIISLYDRNETDFSHNGKRILKPIEARVTEELNGDYSLEITMPRGEKLIETEEIIKAPTPKTPQLITGNKGGHIVLNPPEKPQEILIMDIPDVNTAQRVWRWNLSGLGYSSTGVNGEYSLAITQDGAIVADFITTGTLNGALLQAGTVEAGSISQDYKQSVTDEIKGKTDEVTQNFQVADGELLSRIS